MIQFNWNTINKHTGGDHRQTIKYFEAITNGIVKVPKYVHKILRSKSTKDSFLVNNREFISNRLHGSFYEQYYYLYLASKRNLADFVYKGNLWLPVELCDICIDNNRLLEIIDDKIYFKYEETK